MLDKLLLLTAAWCPQFLQLEKGLQTIKYLQENFEPKLKFQMVTSLQ